MSGTSSEKKAAIISIGKALLGVSFATLAALGGISGVGGIAAATAIPGAALNASDSLIPLLQKLKGKKEDFLEIPIPPWWIGRDASLWQDICNNLESRLPTIVNATAEQLKKETQTPTSQVILRVFTNEVERQAPTWDINANERGLMAVWVVQPFFNKVATLLKSQTDTIQMDVLATKLEAVANKITTIETAALPTNQTPLIDRAIVLPTPTTANTSNTLQQKWLAGTYDVYVCYHEDDIVAVKEIDKRLKAEGILPWFDKRKEPGTTQQSEKNKQIRSIGAAAILIGKNALSNWQVLEVESLITEFTHRQFLRVIPVFLADAPDKPELSVFLENFSGVDFRQSEPDPFAYLMWGITGRRPLIM